MVAQAIPEEIKCKICGELCKRGIKLGCCNTVGCRTCATKSITRDKKCWNCGTETLSKDMINDEELRGKVEKFQKGEWSQVKGNKNDKKTDAALMKPPASVPATKTPDKPFTKTAEQELKAKAALTAATNRNVANRNTAVRKDSAPVVAASPRKKPGMAEVSLEMMKKRNLEFDEKMNDVEKASKELRFGAQLELMFTFDKSQASCRMCGEQFGSEKLTLLHLQQQHKVEYGHLKTVLSPPNNNMLQLCLQKAIKSEFLFAKDQTFPIPVNY